MPFHILKHHFKSENALSLHSELTKLIELKKRETNKWTKDVMKVDKTKKEETRRPAHAYVIK